MTNDVTRRRALQLIANSVGAGLLAFPAAAAAASVDPDLDALWARARHIEDVIARTPALNWAAECDRIFARVPVTAAIQTVPPDRGHEHSQRFVWNHEINDLSLGVRDTTSGMSDADIALRIRDIQLSLWQMREIEAADLFNDALIYEAEVGGDGVPMCSDRHPHELGLWSNVLRGPDVSLLNDGGAPNVDAFRRAVAAMSQMMTEDGIRIVARPRLLVVPPALEPAAGRLMSVLPEKERLPYFVWHYLKDFDNWFVTTDVGAHALMLYERQPILMRVTIHDGEVYIVGTDRRRFGCRDPRAVVGCFPKAEGSTKH